MAASWSLATHTLPGQAPVASAAVLDRLRMHMDDAGYDAQVTEDAVYFTCPLWPPSEDSFGIRSGRIQFIAGRDGRLGLMAQATPRRWQPIAATLLAATLLLPISWGEHALFAIGLIPGIAAPLVFSYLHLKHQLVRFRDLYLAAAGSERRLVSGAV